MTGPFPESAEWKAEMSGLLDALCEESITPEQVQRLERLVLTVPQAEAYYLQYMSLFADVSRRFTVPNPETPRESLAKLDPNKADPRPALPRGGRRMFQQVLLLSAVAAALLVAVVLWPRTFRQPVATTPEPVDDSVALVLQAPGAAWEDTTTPPRAGAPLTPGWLRIKSGFVQMQFYSGATVILEGPAELQVVSRMEAFCARGKLRANVPAQAHGFTIKSPGLELGECGAEFGMQVGADGTEVHVFEGTVDLYDPAAKKGTKEDEIQQVTQQLTTGQSVRQEGPGKVVPIKHDTATFSTAKDLADRWNDGVRRRQKEWQSATQELRADPKLLVYYDFQTGDDASSRTLVNRARTRPALMDALIVGGSSGMGRWPGRQGVEFKRVSDRIRFRVPGEFDSLTLMAWVRVDALPNRFNGLMLTDGWDEGEVHWHLSNAGTLELGVQGPKRKTNAHYYAKEVVPASRLGQWIHLATVYDVDRYEVLHFVDGQVVAQLPLQFEIPLRVGDVEIGNWNLGSHKNPSPVRYFSGSMDEFMLFSRALSETEVERLYDQSRPPW